MSDVTLFGLERSVYTRIARLALEEKGVSYTLRPVEIFGRGGVPAAHLERHPFGRIPVLQHGDFVLYETSAITRYVDDAFPGPPLQPGSAATRARMNQIIGVLDAYAYRPMVWGVFVQCISVPLEGGQADEGVVSSALAQSAACLAAIERLIAPAPFLLGTAICLADLHAFPMLRYLTLTEPGHALLARHTRLARWLDHLLGRPSVSSTRGEYEPEAGTG